MQRNSYITLSMIKQKSFRNSILRYVDGVLSPNNSHFIECYNHGARELNTTTETRRFALYRDPFLILMQSDDFKLEHLKNENISTSPAETYSLFHRIV